MINFTIIIVSLNAEKFIRQTVESVLKQTYSNFEIIIKDGCSQDSTLKEIPQDSRIKTYQKNDQSLYDAMNQAILYAKGDYVIYLNCGDVFFSENVLLEVASVLQDKECDLLYGDYLRDGVKCVQAKRITPFYLYRTPLCHQTIFFRTELLKKRFTYNTNYKILADYNVELGMLKAGCEFLHIDMCICVYLGGGISESQSGIIQKKEERRKILKKHFSKSERIKYALKLAITFPKFRKWLYSNNSPEIIRKIYRDLVNKINSI